MPEANLRSWRVAGLVSFRLVMPALENSIILVVLVLKSHPGSRAAKVGIAVGNKELRAARRQGRCRSQEEETSQTSCKHCASVHDSRQSTAVLPE